MNITKEAVMAQEFMPFISLHSTEEQFLMLPFCLIHKDIKMFRITNQYFKKRLSE